MHLQIGNSKSAMENVSLSTIIGKRNKSILFYSMQHIYHPRDPL
jgi:hypothetical protein